MALTLLLAFAGMKQVELAQAARLDRSEVSRYVNGKRRVPEEARAAILHALELDPPAWGLMEVAASQLEELRGRFHRRSQDYPPHDQRDLVLEPVAAFGSLDPETADRLADWIGESAKELVRGVFQRLRDRRP